jgi:hypothetical protein
MTLSSGSRARRWNSTTLASSTGEITVLYVFRRPSRHQKWFHASPLGDSLGFLSEKGIAVALDDFGTGHASLSHLRQFCVDWVKLHRSFVREVAIVHGVISIA